MHLITSRRQNGKTFGQGQAGIAVFSTPTEATFETKIKCKPKI